MTSSPAERFGVAMGAMLVTFGAEADKHRVHGYWMALQDLDLEAVLRAIAQCMATDERLPVPARIRAVATGSDNAGERAQLAWVEFNRLIDIHGGYQSPNVTDANLLRTIESVGGWQYVCGMKESEFHSFLRPKFLAAYEGFATMPAHRLPEPKPLVGICQDHNQRVSGGRLTSLAETVLKISTTNGRAAG